MKAGGLGMERSGTMRQFGIKAREMANDKQEFGIQRPGLAIQRQGLAGRSWRLAGRLFGIFFLICCLMILSGSAWGAVTGSISGTVKDPAGRAVPDAKVTAREVNTGISHETRSNAGGYYTLPVLPVGRYELDVRAAGFETCERQDVTLDTDAALTIDCTLKVGKISGDGERDRQRAACGDGEHAVWRSDYGARDDVGSFRRAQLYGFAARCSQEWLPRRRLARRRCRMWARRFWIASGTLNPGSDFQ